MEERGRRTCSPSNSAGLCAPAPAGSTASPLTPWQRPAGSGGHRSVFEEASFQLRPDSCREGQARARTKSLRQCLQTERVADKTGKRGAGEVGQWGGAPLHGRASGTGRRSLGVVGRADVGHRMLPSSLPSPAPGTGSSG